MLLAFGFVLALIFPLLASADEPVASYIFPAGGQRGTTVAFRVGGLYLHGRAGFEMLGAGVSASPEIREGETVWFEGPVIPLPASQNQEDYPRDCTGKVKIEGDAELGPRYWRAWTSQGATPARKFIIGDLPEIVEQEIDGSPVPVEVTTPVTINGRIFPREDVDIWAFRARAGQRFTCEVFAKRIGSPLEARLEITDPRGRHAAEASDRIDGDPRLHFEAHQDGVYQARIHDLNLGGLQHYVYRLTITPEPYVDLVFPLGGQRGHILQTELIGVGLNSGTAELALPAEAPKVFQAVFNMAGRRTNPVLLELDDYPEQIESEPNDSPQSVNPVNPPVVFNGRIGVPGDVDYWAVTAKKDQTLEFDVRGARLGSPIDSVLTIFDSKGKEVARNDDLGNDQTDSQLQFKAPADGVYSVRVEERFASRGNARFAYRLRIAPAPPPDFELTLGADTVNVFREVTGLSDEEKKKRALPKPGKLRIDAVRLGGYSGPVELTVDGLPSGVTIQSAKIAEKQTRTELTFIAASSAKIQPAHLVVRGTATIDGRTVTRTALFPVTRGDPPLDNVLLMVALPTPFKLVGEYLMSYGTRGSNYRRRYHIDRADFKGPLTVRLADRQVRHLQGVKGPTLSVPGDVSDFEYAVSFPPWMEIGRTSRSAVMGSAIVNDTDGTEHVVSYSSGEQSDQIIAVVSPGFLSVEADKRSLLALPDTTVELPLRVQRDRTLIGEALKIVLIVPRHFKGVTADSVVVPSDKNEATLRIRFGSPLGTFNMPVTIRMTTVNAKPPHTAETTVELVAFDTARK